MQKPSFTEINFPGNQYVRKETEKSTFVLHYSAGWDNARGMFNGWAKDRLGRVSTAYGIENDGTIFRAFDASRYYGYALYINAHGNRIPSYLKPLKTRKQDIKLNAQAIQVEVCNWGALKYKEGKFLSWAGYEVPEEKVIDYAGAKFRGLRFFERITEQEIESLRQLILYHHLKDGIPLAYNEDMWELSENALKGAPGIWSHCSYRTDKTDIHPQPELIEMLQSLELPF